MGEKFISGIIILNDSFEEQINLKDEIDKFNESTKQKNQIKKKKKYRLRKTLRDFLKEGKRFLMLSKKQNISKRKTDLKILKELEKNLKY